MEYKLFLRDSTGNYELPSLEVPLTRVKYEKMTTVEPLSANVYDDYIATKRIFTHTWAYMTREEYELLDAIYERQKSTWTYPELTVQNDNVTDLVVKFTLGKRDIIDNCGTVENVTVEFRETRQLQPVVSA